MCSGLAVMCQGAVLCPPSDPWSHMQYFLHACSACCTGSHRKIVCACMHPIAGGAVAISPCILQLLGVTTEIEQGRGRGGSVKSDHLLVCICITHSFCMFLQRLEFLACSPLSGARVLWPLGSSFLPCVPWKRCRVQSVVGFATTGVFICRRVTIKLITFSTRVEFDLVKCFSQIFMYM